MKLSDVLPHVEDVFATLARDGRDGALAVVAALEHDLLVLDTVPPERQEQYLRRIQLQLPAELERARIKTLRVTRPQFAEIVVAVLRALILKL